MPPAPEETFAQPHSPVGGKPAGVNRKRRWLLAVAAIGLVAVGLGIALPRGDPKYDPPRLVVVKQVEPNGRKVVVFRLDAPKQAAASPLTMSTASPSTSEERKPALQAVGRSPFQFMEVQTPQGTDFFLSPPIVVGAGGSLGFSVLPPDDAVWRLRCNVPWPRDDDYTTDWANTGFLRAVWNAARQRWRESSANSWWQRSPVVPVRWKAIPVFGIIESELITNAVPTAAENGLLQSIGNGTNN